MAEQGRHRTFTGRRFLRGGAGTPGLSGAQAERLHLPLRPPELEAASPRPGSMISDDYAHGRRDGLRLALAILAAEEAKWAALLGESPSWRTNGIRQVRHKTLQVAQSRVQTALNRLAPKSGDAIDPEIAAEVAKAGL